MSEKMRKVIKPWLMIIPAAVVVICAIVGIKAGSQDCKQIKAEEISTEWMNYIVEKVAEEGKSGGIVLGQTLTADESKSSKPVENTKASEALDTDGCIFKDGTYQGSSQGFAGPITVSLVIKDSKIKSIKIVKTSDGAEYIKKASSILGAIVTTQSTDVDTVSGATYSSNGIIGAVKAALKKALVKKSSDDSDEIDDSGKNDDTDEKEVTPEVTPQVTGAFPYPDGEYTGTAIGFRGDVTVKITIKDATITDISLVSNEDDQPFFSNAWALVASILEKQTVEVDTVSGATYSSNGIIGAVKAALEKAGKSIGSGNGNSSGDSDGGANGNSSGNSDGSSNFDLTGGDSTEDSQTVYFPYPDGVYRGSAYGYQSDIVVDVTLSSGKITSITLIEEDETRSFFTRAWKIVEEMISRQTAEVEVVSGATYSSKGIIDAVTEAIGKAKATSEANSGESETGNPGVDNSGAGDSGKTETGNKGTGDSGTDNSGSGDTGTNNPETGDSGTNNSESGDSTDSDKKDDGNSSSDSDKNQGGSGSSDKNQSPKYKDGTYTAKSTVIDPDGYSFCDYDIQMQVIITNGLVTEIKNINPLYVDYLEDESEWDTNDACLKLAANGRKTTKKTIKGVVSQIIENNSTENVDVVSTATCSSKAIISAVEEVLKSAELVSDGD